MSDWFEVPHRPTEAEYADLPVLNIEQLLQQNRAERDAERVKLCYAKLGEPDESNGMKVCREPIFFMSPEQAADAGCFSGWYHQDPNLDLTHWPVDRSATL